MTIFLKCCMKILIVEPFFTSSHKKWALGLQKNSCHEVEILSLKGRHWKWRMYGGAVSLADKFEKLDFQPDLILATDMLDFSTFLGLTRKKTAGIPTAIYFHENQITYPWSPEDQDVPLQRNNQYGFLNYTSALAADAVFFNSNFHKNAFLDALPVFLKQFPDNRNLDTIQTIKSKSEVLHLGMDLERFDIFQSQHQETAPIILWNHRWEYDKNPTSFFNLLFQLKSENINFKLVVLGESYQKMPPIFEKAKSELSNNILHFGYADSFESYAQWLQQADIYPVTSNQDFFGGSVVEAIYCNCHPILPNRLAYPEHIPSENHSDYFYENEVELYEKLKGVMNNIAEIRGKVKYQKFVASYDWKECIENYDNAFEALKGN